MLRTRTFVFPAVLTAALMTGSAGAAQTDDVGALKDQISQLQAKVAELQQKLDEKQSSNRPMTQPIDPFEQMEAMDRQIQALMGQPMGGMGIMPAHASMRSHAPAFTPDYDVKATDKAYVISFDMPGMDKSKINVEVKEGNLLVSGERSSESKEDQGGKFYRQERSFGYFSRVIPLPGDVKPETVQAKYENGVLNITIEKKEAQKQVPVKQKIEVK